MINIYEFSNYKVFVQKMLSERANRGRGEYGRLASFLRVSSVAISQIFRGERDLSVEQALATAKFLNLSHEEQDYFLLLVQFSRAGTKDLQLYYAGKIKSTQERRRELAARHEQKKKLSENVKAIFYSSWHYSAIRIASSVPGCHSVDQLAVRLQLNRAVVKEAVEFLVENDLCVSIPEGVTLGPTSTMLAPDSPFIHNHRRNLRLKGLEHLQKHTSEDLFYSGFVSLSRQDARLLRARLVDVVDQFIKTVKDSPAEEVACLNLDWFRLQN